MFGEKIYIYWVGKEKKQQKGTSTGAFAHTFVPAHFILGHTRVLALVDARHRLQHGQPEEEWRQEPIY
jgi:hypothetical protein